jgi:nicotinate dehydrogenase subunit B
VTPSALAHLTAAELLQQAGTLLVLRTVEAAVEPLLCISASDSVIGFCGHVDLGTGIRTALAQIVAEELDIAAERVEMVLGDTARTPDQGATIASNSIQKAAVPLRSAAAQARAALVELAAVRLGAHVAELEVAEGHISVRNSDLSITFGQLIGSARIHLPLNEAQPLKAASGYRVVGKRQPRVDIPAKATGQRVFVHDMRVEGMLHGRVVRPPYVGIDHGPFVGTSLVAVDRDSIAHLPGIVAVVVEGDFIGIVAEREEQAAAAAEALQVEWKPVPQLRPLDDLAAALTANPSTPRRLQDKGNVDGALAGAAQRLSRRYVWPYQLHASIGPSCAVADVRGDGASVWSGTQNPHELRNDIARLLGMAVTAVEVIRMEAAGCYGRNCADDVSADAALLSRAVGLPVRVQLTREQEHLWEPKGTAQLMEVDGGLDAQGHATAYDYQSRYPSNGASTLALLLTGRIPPTAPVWEMGDRTCVAPYDYRNMRVTIHDMAPIVRASWLRGVSALPNTFAHESWIDEAAAAAAVDPIEYRLRYLNDPRVRELVLQTAERAHWQAHTSWGSLGAAGDVLRGRGFAYALYVHGKFPGEQAAWSTWVADVEVNRTSGEVCVTRVTTGHDAGLMINPAGVQHQIHGNVIQSISRATREAVSFSQGMPAAREWGGYPIITFPELPQIDNLMIDRPEQPPLGVGESASVPSAAAIANAIYDACGVRFREPPFTPEKIRAGLGLAQLPETTQSATEPLARKSPAGMPAPARGARPWRTFLAGASISLAGLAAALLPWRAAIAPIERPDPGAYSAATIERGRQLAALGDCAVCHTSVGGHTNAGGRPLETPFGVIYTTNITPDPETGLGNWSYTAFERAMREGIHRDGRHLYPAFPYMHFTRTSEPDLQALYAYLMAQEPVRQRPPLTRLGFPFNLRPLMAGWNALFLKVGTLAADPLQSDPWNRGRYLVEGLGHCSACHSPRNALGAEIDGEGDHLSGGWADGWEAPALTRLSIAPVPWDKESLYEYLRTGYSPLHGAAAGPMAPVIEELLTLPDQDIDAIAIYLASLNPPGLSAERKGVATALEARAVTASAAAAMASSSGTAGMRLYEGACAVCHEGGDRPDVFGIRPSLAVNTNLHSDRPDNLVRVIMEGVSTQASGRHGAMPGFRNHFDDRQMNALVRYLRATFAPDRPAWTEVEQTISRLRGAQTTAAASAAKPVAATPSGAHL